MEKDIIASWEKNAPEWIDAIDSSTIGSRNFTNNALLEILKGASAIKILDCGCGEGWLTRTLTKMGKQPVGIDAIDTLIANAKQKGPEPYYVLSYEEIINGKPIPESPYDSVVFNFSLFQKEGVGDLIRMIKKGIRANGNIVIQTLHPSFLSQRKLAYKSQWIPNSWEGLPGKFVEGHPFYTRTFEDWHTVFRNCDLSVETLKEVVSDENAPVSILFVLKKEL